MMYAIDTEEKLNWLLNALENNELHFVSQTLTEEDHKEISRELAAGRAAIKQREAAQQTATHQQNPAKEAVLA